VKTGSTMKKLGIIMFAVTLLSCNLGSDGEDDNFDSGVFFAELERRRSAWEELGINHYRFIMDVSSSAGGPSAAFVTVFPDREPEVLFWSDSGPPPFWVTSPPSNVDPDEPFWPFQGITLTELFASFDDFFRSLVESGFIIRVSYNERYHFPERMNNYFPPGGGWPTDGGGISFSITNFEVLRNSND